jgi:hypothetical protein
METAVDFKYQVLYRDVLYELIHVPKEEKYKYLMEKLLETKRFNIYKGKREDYYTIQTVYNPHYVTYNIDGNKVRRLYVIVKCGIEVLGMTISKKSTDGKNCCWKNYKKQLYEIAKNNGIKNRSKMDKDELIKVLMKL